jgi:hypothetical protein
MNFCTLREQRLIRFADVEQFNVFGIAVDLRMVHDFADDDGADLGICILLARGLFAHRYEVKCAGALLVSSEGDIRLGGVETFSDQSPPNIFDGLYSTGQCFGNFGILSFL